MSSNAIENASHDMHAFEISPTRHIQGEEGQGCRPTIWFELEFKRIQFGSNGNGKGIT